MVNYFSLFQTKTAQGQNDESNHVNSVGFMDDTSNIIFTGQDDGVIQVIVIKWILLKCPNQYIPCIDLGPSMPG